MNLPDEGELLSAIAVQSDAGILAVGGVNTPTGARGALVRWHADGRLDSGFGGDGGAERGRSLYPALDAHTGPDTGFQSVALQPDGKIVVGGTYGAQILVARFTPDGALDRRFGENGRATLPETITRVDGVSVSRVVLQPDGRIVLLATVSSPTGRDTSDEFAIVRARFLPDGSPDPTFGKLVLSPPPPHNLPRPLPPDLPPDQPPRSHRIGWDIQNVTGIGREAVYDAVILSGAHPGIIGVGATDEGAFRGGFLITRYLSDGEVDIRSTGAQGAIETEIPGGGGGYATACVVDPEEGTLTVAGPISTLGTQGVGLARYLLSG